MSKVILEVQIINIDEAIKKAERLVALLQEAQQLIALLGNSGLSIKHQISKLKLHGIGIKRAEGRRTE